LILKAGNYLDLSMWQNGYSEHIELSYKLKKNGFNIYHQSDPKISCTHLKYGVNSMDKFNNKYYNQKINVLEYKLGELVKMSVKKNLNYFSKMPASLIQDMPVLTHTMRGDIDE